MSCFVQTQSILLCTSNASAISGQFAPAFITALSESMCRTESCGYRNEERSSLVLPALRYSPFSRGFVEQIGGHYVSIQLASLDDVAPEELIAAPVKYENGRDNKWWVEPAETRHL